MTMIAEGGPNPLGDGLVEELAWVHGIIRGNLATISDIAAAVNGGADGGAIQARIKDLSASSVLWTLRVNCMRYCGLVHSHHGGEDTHVFPALRRINPALRPVIDKLEADHVVVARYLDEVEAAAERIVGDPAARSALARALQNLSAHLLTHLDYEESNLNPTLRRLTSWPRG